MTAGSQTNKVFLGRAHILKTKEKWMSEEFVDEYSERDQNFALPHPSLFSPTERRNMMPYFFATSQVVEDVVKNVFVDRNPADLYSDIKKLVDYYHHVNSTMNGGKDAATHILAKASAQDYYKESFMLARGSYSNITKQQSHKYAKEFPSISDDTFNAYVKLMTPATEKVRKETDSYEAFTTPTYVAPALLHILNLCKPQRSDENWQRHLNRVWVEMGNQLLMDRHTFGCDYISWRNESKYSRDAEPIFVRPAAYILGGIFNEIGLDSAEKVAAFSQKIERLTRYAGAAKTLFLLSEYIKPETMDSSIKQVEFSKHDIEYLAAYADRTSSLPNLTQAEKKLCDILNQPAVKTFIESVAAEPKKYVKCVVNPTLSTWNVHTTQDNQIDDITFVERLGKQTIDIANNPPPPLPPEPKRSWWSF